MFTYQYDMTISYTNIIFSGVSAEDVTFIKLQHFRIRSSVYSNYIEKFFILVSEGKYNFGDMFIIRKC